MPSLAEIAKPNRMLSKYNSRSHLELASTHLMEPGKIIQDGKLVVDGNSFTIASVVTASKCVCRKYTDLGCFG